METGNMTVSVQHGADWDLCGEARQARRPLATGTYWLWAPSPAPEVDTATEIICAARARKDNMLAFLKFELEPPACADHDAQPEPRRFGHVVFEQLFQCSDTLVASRVGAK